MTILKWYSTLILMLGLVLNIYKCGKENDKMQVFTSILIETPIIIYLILS